MGVKKLGIGNLRLKFLIGTFLTETGDSDYEATS